jgi:uncharacterized protein (DUF1015 family)
MVGIVKPFRGFRFAENLKNLGLLVCPPYDVMDIERKKHFESKHPLNFVRIVLSRGTKENAITMLKSWIDRKFIIQDEKESIYLLRQTFEFDGQKVKREGIFVLVSINAPIYRHELTKEEVVEDRFGLLELSEFNLCPIFLLADERVPKPTLQKVRFVGSFTDDEKVEHEFFVVDDEMTVQNVCSYLNKTSFLIADGHHRFEAVKKAREIYGYEYFMSYVTFDYEGIRIFPTHRLMEDEEKARIVVKRLKDFFNFYEASDNISSQHTIRDIHLIFKKNGKNVIKLIPKENLPDTIEEFSDVKVMLLHKLALYDMEYFLTYERDLINCIKFIEEGRISLAIILPPVDVREVWKVAKMGNILPRKSTYFWPKVPSGLVLNKL